ncbi:hypothetical protein Tdes44962_MAKER03780 [Teratosphaeria destructans]|uniref:Uncharacterized protein n=1 Tax=Teratosphaeria destructans TaxID=418781 RepID=A0A9W7W0N8_9PEZI|nr:hypothetical protein Tdes44962_MAKER03780 [Teratosphaeria destructans]
MGGLWYRRKPAPSHPAIAQHCPLMDLPSELRNMIWTSIAQSFDTFSVQRIDLRDHRPQRPSLIRVCKQIKSEFPGIFYAEVPRFATVMHAHIDNFDAEQLMWSMKHMSRPALRLIQLITGNYVRFNKAGTCRQDLDMGWFASDKHFETDYRIEYA